MKQVSGLILLAFAAAMMFAKLVPNSGENSWRTHSRPQINIDGIVGCYEDVRGYRIQVDPDRLSSSSIEFEILGYFQGKEINFIEVEKEVYFDTNDRALRSGRDLMGWKISVYGEPEYSIIEILDEDGRSIIFRRVLC